MVKNYECSTERQQVVYVYIRDHGRLDVEHQRESRGPKAL